MKEWVINTGISQVLNMVKVLHVKQEKLFDKA